jgi:hypothetical protein
VHQPATLWHILRQAILRAVLRGMMETGVWTATRMVMVVIMVVMKRVSKRSFCCYGRTALGSCDLSLVIIFSSRKAFAWHLSHLLAGTAQQCGSTQHTALRPETFWTSFSLPVSSQSVLLATFL